MKCPTYDQLQLAALWLENNEGDEAGDCKAVAEWLKHEADEAMIRSEARRGGVTVAALRRKIAERAFL